MTTLREAAQQALEALEWHLERGAWGADIEGVTVALRSALAEPVQEPVAWLQPKTVDAQARPDLGYETCSKDDYGAFPVYRAPHKAEPMQEPVAWLYEAGTDRTLHWHKPPLYGTPLYTAAPQRQPLTEQVDLSRCPQCNGPADNGHDRSIPPNPYFCSKCMDEPVADQTLDDAMQQPRAMAQAYESGYNAGVAARDAEHQQTLALQQRSYEREIQLDVEAERERCLRLIDEHVRAVDAEDLVRAIKEGKE